MQVKLIKDSTANGIRICTFVLVYPRLIHSELMTHRVFSRNAASSRAIPTAAIIQNLRDDPAEIVWWGKNISGMQAKEELKGWQLKLAKFGWATARELAILAARFMGAVGLHKQIANRVLEPFQNIRVVVTSTEWNNFFNLRNDADAQPEFGALARMMKEAMEASTPEVLQPGEWHIPYIETVQMPNRIAYLQPELNKTGHFEITLEQALTISASMAAQESYRKSDPSLEKAKKIFTRLIESKPAHCFSADTEVLTKEGYKFWRDVSYDDYLADICIKTGKLIGWAKPLKLIIGSHTGNMYSVDSKDVSFDVTDQHTMLGHLVSNQFTRYSPIDVQAFNIGEITSKKYRKNTLGEVECRMLTAPYVNSYVSPLGKLIGMYIGDGFRTDNTISFHVKKERKIEYLHTVLNELNLQYSCRHETDGTTSFRIYKCATATDILDKCNSGSANKQMGTWNLEHYVGIFDGLKNSDGSVKRNTWCYSTVSCQLREDILNTASLVGLTVKETSKQRNSFNFMIQTTNTGRVNDSRTIKESGVQIRHVQDEPVYCATMPSGGLCVRRNGKTLVTGNSSPTEHQAMAMQHPRPTGLKKSGGKFSPVFDSSLWEDGVTHVSKDGRYWSGNFSGYIQHRQLLSSHDVKG